MMKITNLCIAAVFASALGAMGCEAGDDEVVLINEGETDDSVVGKHIREPRITEEIRVSSRDAGCSRFGTDPWVCGNYTASGEVDVLVVDDEVTLRGNITTPAFDDSLYVFEANHEGFGVPNLRFVKYSQFLYARSPRSGDWNRLECPGMTYFSSRVVVYMDEGTIMDVDSDVTRTLEECGAPDGEIQIGSFAFPKSRLFSLQGTYNYDVEINKP